MTTGGTRLVTDHRLNAARRELDAACLRVAQSSEPRGPLLAAVGLPAPGDTEDHSRRSRVATRLRAEGGNGKMLRIHLTDSKQEAALIDAIQRERTDEYHELVESTRQFHAELHRERRRGRATYTELEESDVDLARYQKWLAGIRARDYFDAPGGDEAAAAVSACEEALAQFESEALSAELDESSPRGRPGLRAVEGGND